MDASDRSRSRSQIFKIESAQQNGAYVVQVSGEIDLGNIALLEAALSGGIHKSQNVILDSQHLTYIDSTGLNLLMSLHKRGIRFVLVGPSPIVLKLLQLTGLDTVWPVATSLDEAHTMLAEKG